MSAELISFSCRFPEEELALDADFFLVFSFLQALWAYWHIGNIGRWGLCAGILERENVSVS